MGNEGTVRASRQGCVHRDLQDKIRVEHAGIIRLRGFDFGFDPAACGVCPGRCCRGQSGKIWVSGQEINAISRFLATNPVDFITRCTHRVDNRLTIRERRDEDGFRCIFLETDPDIRCGIYPVRPRQCRTFPFWDDFRDPGRPPADECPGIRPFEGQAPE